MLQARHLAVQLSILAALFVAFNFAVLRSVKRVPAVRIIRLAQESKPATDIFIGNSVMVSGFKEAVFKSMLPKRQALNLTLGATDPAEQYLLTNLYFSGPGGKAPKPATLYYGIMDLMLTKSTRAKFEDLIGNRALALIHKENPKMLDFYFNGDSLARLQFRVAAAIPAVVYRPQLWRGVEMARRRAGSLGRHQEATNEFGRVEDFQALKLSRNEAFRQACRDGARPSAHFNAPVQEIVRICKEKGVRLIFVRVPASTEHRRTVYQAPEWQAYDAHMQKLMKDEGVEYIDATTWIDDKGFSDGIHLTAEAGNQFTRRLLQATNKIP